MVHQHKNQKDVSNRKYREVSKLQHRKTVHSYELRTYFSEQSLRQVIKKANITVGMSVHASIRR
jgi:hypothetical protein